LDRDRIFSDEIVRDADQNHLEVLYVDGTQPLEDMVIDLASRFDLARAPIDGSVGCFGKWGDTVADHSERQTSGRIA
jgi:hypothetical protein